MHTNAIIVFYHFCTLICVRFLLSHQNPRSKSLVLLILHTLIVYQFILNLNWLIFTIFSFKQQIIVLGCLMSANWRYIHLTALSNENWAEFIVLSTWIIMFDHVVLNTLQCQISSCEVCFLILLMNLHRDCILVCSVCYFTWNGCGRIHSIWPIWLFL